MKVCTFLVEGFETVEALAVVDVLKRAKIQVDMVSALNEEYITSAQQVTVKADYMYDEYDFTDVDVFFLPGGPGTRNYYKNERLMALITQMCEEGKIIAAICAAPTVFAKLNLLEGKRATCFPSCEGDMAGAILVDAKVVTEGNIITSKGMGTSIDLGLELIAQLMDKEAADRIGSQIQYY